MTTELVKYDFTETSGLTLSDSSGNNQDANLYELVFDGSNWNSTQITDANEANWLTPGSGGPFGQSSSVKSFQFVSDERLYLFCPTVFVPHLGTNSKDFSLSMWVYPSSDIDPSVPSTNFMSVFGSNTDNTSNGDFQISVKPGGGTNTLYIHSNGTYSHEIGTVTTNAWNNIVFTYDHNSGTNSELKTYLNGSTENTYSNTQISPNSSNGLQINVIKIGMNRNEDDGGKFFDGYISSFALYDGILTSSEVSTLYSTNEICYHKDTKVLTKEGYKIISNLQKGDLIKTYHNNYQPLSKLMISRNITQEFILFPKDSISKGIPDNDIMITKGHPIFYNNDYYLSENFINNKIKIVKDNSLFIYHLMFDTHEVIYTNNLKTTSLPNITNYNNLYLKENEYINKNKYNKNNIGKHYPPYMLHEDPLMIKLLYLNN